MPSTSGIPWVMCFADFADGFPIELSLTGPDGLRRSKQVATKTGAGSWQLTDVSFPIEGEYHLTGSQGPETVETSHHRSLDRRTTALLPSVVKLGRSLLVVVADPDRSGGSEPAYLYRHPPGSGIGHYEYVTRLDDIELNGDGEGAIRLHTSESDVAGEYLILAGGIQMRLEVKA